MTPRSSTCIEQLSGSWSFLSWSPWPQGAAARWYQATAFSARSGRAHYFFKALDWALATNDLRLVRQIAEPGCEGCGEFMRMSRAIPATVARYVVDSAVIAHPHAQMAAELGVDVKLHVTPSVSDVPDADSFHLLVCLNWRRDDWTVDQLWSY